MALLVVGFLWGSACIYFHIYPFSVLQRAKHAAEAWEWILQEEPVTFVRFESTDVDTPSGPAARESEHMADEFILIGGGPWENLKICPKFGCLAWILDRHGNVRHTWEIDPERIIDSMEGYVGQVTSKNLKPHDWYLSNQGDLFVIFESIGTYPYGGSIARFDWNGNLIWSTNNRAHHWMTVDADGLMYMPAQKTADTPLMIGDTVARFHCNKGGIEIDTINVVSPSGKIVEEIDVLDKLVNYGIVGLLDATYNDCDPLHMNFVQVVWPQLAANVDQVEIGDLIVSLRNINSIIVLSNTDRAIKWVSAGLTIGQHSPRPSDQGDIMIFDNRGGPREYGGSRVARMWIGAQSIETVFPSAGTDPSIDFYTKYAGHIVRHPDANRILVALTSSGRVLEIDLDSGELLWEYIKQFGSSGYPGADENYVRVESYGAYYVLEPAVLARLKEMKP